MKGRFLGTRASCPHRAEGPQAPGARTSRPRPSIAWVRVTGRPPVRTENRIRSPTETLGQLVREGKAVTCLPVSTGSWQAGTLETSPYPAGTDPNGRWLARLECSSCATTAIGNTAILGSRAAGGRYARRALGGSRNGCLRTANRQAVHGTRYMKAKRTAHGNTATTFGMVIRSAGKRFPKHSVADG